MPRLRPHHCQPTSPLHRTPNTTKNCGLRSLRVLWTFPVTVVNFLEAVGFYLMEPWGTTITTKEYGSTLVKIHAGSLRQFPMPIYSSCTMIGKYAMGCLCTRRHSSILIPLASLKHLLRKCCVNGQFPRWQHNCSHLVSWVCQHTCKPQWICLSSHFTNCARDVLQWLSPPINRLGAEEMI